MFPSSLLAPLLVALSVRDVRAVVQPCAALLSQGWAASSTNVLNVSEEVAIAWDTPPCALSQQCRASDVLELQFVYASSVDHGGWVGFGVRANSTSGMSGMDAWWLKANSTHTLAYDMFSFAERRSNMRHDVLADDLRVMDSGFAAAGPLGASVSCVRVRRALVTGDPMDVPINLGGPTPVALAWGSGQDDTLARLPYHSPKNHSTLDIDFLAVPPARTNITLAPGVLSVSHGVVQPSDVYLSLSFDFTGTAPGKGWFGFGIRGGTGMANADVWLVKPRGGACVVQDARSVRYGLPYADSRQDVHVHSCTVTGPHMLVTLRRKLDTGDVDDRPVDVTSPVPVMYAWSASAEDWGSHGASRFVAALDFRVEGSGTLATRAAFEAWKDSRLKAYSFHALVMGGVWGFAVPIAILTARFGKPGGTGLSVHTRVATVALTLTLPAAGQAMIAGSESTGGDGPDRPYASVHRVLGVLLAVMLVVQAILGGLTAVWLRGAHKPPAVWALVRIAHRWLGYTEMALAAANLVLGMNLLASSTGTALMLVWLVALALVYAGMAAMSAHTEHKTLSKTLLAPVEDLRHVLARSTQSCISMAEVRASKQLGRKLLLWRGLVVDVSVFIEHHPGGAYLLASLLGEDVTTFFSGKGSAGHVHSAAAISLLLKMVIGALKADERELTWSISPEPVNEESTSTSEWVVVEKSVVTPADAVRPVVRLRLRNSAGMGRVISPLEWRPSSFGRYVTVQLRSGSGPAPPLVDKGFLPAGSGGQSSAEVAMHALMPRGSADGRVHPEPPALALRSTPSEHDTLSSYNSGIVTVEARRSSVATARRERAEDAGLPSPPASNVFTPSPGPEEHEGGNGTSKHAQSAASPGHASPDSPTLSPRRNKRGSLLGRITLSALESGASAGASHRARADTGELADVVERPYTIVRIPGTSDLALYVRRYPAGAMSPLLTSVPTGGSVTLSGPFGLGLRLDSDTMGGTVVAVVQGTCTTVVLDLLQHIWATRCDKLVRQGVTPPECPFPGFLGSLNTLGVESTASLLRTRTGDSYASEGLTLREGGSEAGGGSTGRGVRGTALRVVLLACYREEDAVIEKQTLAWLAANSAGDVSLHYNFSRKGRRSSADGNPPSTAEELGASTLSFGRLTPARLVGVLPTSDLMSVLACGRPQFQETVRELFLSLGLPPGMFSFVS